MLIRQGEWFDAYNKGTRNGAIWTMNVYVKTTDKPNEWTQITGATYQNIPSTSADTTKWVYNAAEGQQEHGYTFGEPVDNVTEIRLEAKTSGGDTASTFISAAEIYVYGIENAHETYGSLLSNLTGKADSEQTLDGNNSTVASSAIDGNVNTYWHSKYSAGNGEPATPSEDQTSLIANNTYTITLGEKATVKAFSYQPRNNYSGTTIANGAIKTCKIEYSTDYEQTWTEVKHNQTWEYKAKDTDGYLDNCTEKFIAFPDGVTGVTNVKITALTTDGTAKNNFINAAEFRLYGSVDEVQDVALGAPPLSVNRPKENAAVGAAEKKDEGNYSVASTVWKDRSGKEVQSFAKYLGYTLEVTLQAEDGYKFTEDSIPTKIATDNGDVSASAAIGTGGKTMTVTATFNDLKVERMRYTPDASGNIVIPKSDMAFFNDLTDLTVTMVYRFTAPSAKPYALFTLENNAGQFFTIWHQPQGNGRLFYAYKESAGDLFYTRGHLLANDTKWHKMSFSLTSSDRKLTISYDGSPKALETNPNAANASGAVNASTWWKPYFFAGAYSSALVGKKMTNGTTSLANLSDFEGDIKYIEIIDKSYVGADALATEHGKVNAAYSVEFNAFKDLVTEASDDSYTKETWDNYTANDKAGADAAATSDITNKEWVCLNSVDTMKAAVEKLRVCLHCFVDGKCNICGVLKDDKNCTVDVYLGADKQDDQSRTVERGARYRATAPEEKDGKKFSHWSDSEGGARVIGTGYNYDFYVTRSMSVYAVYETDATKKDEPAVTMSNMYAKKIAGVNRVYFESTRNVPEGYEVVEQGILYGTTNVGEENFKLDSDNSTPMASVRKYVGSGKGLKGALTLSINVGARTDTTVYARGYVVVKKTGSSDVQVVYTALVSNTYNGLMASSTP